VVAEKENGGQPDFCGAVAETHPQQGFGRYFLSLWETDTM